MSPEKIDLIEAIRADLAERTLPSPVATLAVRVTYDCPAGPTYDDTLTATLLDGTSMEIAFGSAISDELTELADSHPDMRLQDFTITLIEIPAPPTRTYTVTWEMEIDATSPRSAAEKAWAAQRRRGSIANVFTVEAPDGTRVRVDLEEDAETVAA
nr:hypothetical protein KPHV_85610 [Kitasatospora purpeofusca]